MSRAGVHRYDPPIVSDALTLRGRVSGVVRRLPVAVVLSRFAMVGVSVAAVQFGLVTALVFLGVPIQPAVAMTYVVVLVMHFTLNRQWVFASESGYAFHISGQGVRYLMVAGTSYAGTALGTLVLSSLLDIPDLAAFFLASALMAAFSFLALRLWIFRARPAHGDPPG